MSQVMLESFLSVSKTIGYGLIMTIGVVLELGVVIFITVCICEFIFNKSNEKIKKYFKKLCKWIGIIFKYFINIYALFCISYAIYDCFFK